MSNTTASLPDHITLTEGYSGRLDGRLTGERWTVGPARLSKISVGEMDNNVYIVESVATGDVLLIDAANDAPQLISHLKEHAPAVEEVLTTHLHADHWIGLAETVEALDSPPSPPPETPARSTSPRTVTSRTGTSSPSVTCGSR